MKDNLLMIKDTEMEFYMIIKIERFFLMLNK